MINQTGYYTNKKGFDRRGMPRFRVKANCSYQSFDPMLYYEDYNICKIEDISLGGMSFLSKNSYNLNSRLFFTIAVYDSSVDEPVNAVGDVKWVSLCKASPYQYRVGVRFVKILQDDLISLSHYFN